MNIKDFCQEMQISRATLYRRAQNAGITINRDEHGNLIPETVAALGNLFDAINADGMAAVAAEKGEPLNRIDDQSVNISTDTERDHEGAETAGTTSSTESVGTSIPTTALDRLRELESECSRLTVERDAARREADIWREQAQQWREQATRSDARIDRLLNAGAQTDKQPRSFTERLRGLFSKPRS